jgi:hypothetical protein
MSPESQMALSQPKWQPARAGAGIVNRQETGPWIISQHRPVAAKAFEKAATTATPGGFFAGSWTWGPGAALTR